MNLLAEVRAPESPGLRGRESWRVERLHDLIGKLPLVGRKARRIVPAQSSSDVVVNPRLRASELVGAPMQLPNLLEQRLEHLVIDRQQEPTLLAAERRPDHVEVDTAGGRFFGRNLQRTGPPAAARALLHTRAECGDLRCAQSGQRLALAPLVFVLCAAGGCNPEQSSTNRDNDCSHNIVEMDSVTARKGGDHDVPAVWTEPDDRGANDNAHHPGNPRHELDEPLAHTPLVLHEQHAAQLGEPLGRRIVECSEDRLAVGDGQGKHRRLDQQRVVELVCDVLETPAPEQLRKLEHILIAHGGCRRASRGDHMFVRPALDRGRPRCAAKAPLGRVGTGRPRSPPLLGARLGCPPGCFPLEVAGVSERHLTTRAVAVLSLDDVVKFVRELHARRSTCTFCECPRCGQEPLVVEPLPVLFRLPDLEDSEETGAAEARRVEDQTGGRVGVHVQPRPHAVVVLRGPVARLDGKFVYHRDRQLRLRLRKPLTGS